MEETSLAYSLLNTCQDERMENTRPPLDNKNRISMQKSTFYVVLLSVSIFLIGSEILVYLLSNQNNSCQCIIPDGYFVSAKRNSSLNVLPGATLPLVYVKQTTKSQTSATASPQVSLHIGTSFAATTSATETTKEATDCPANWISYGQSCYFFSNQSLKWLDSMIKCQNLNSYLVEITSDDENQFLKRHAELLDRRETRDCFKTSSNQYNGLKSTTYDGHTCQRWDSQSPHKHTRNQANRFPDTSVADAANYCRDPDGEGLPWCYTTDPKIRWQYCGIYKCPGGKYWTGIVKLEENWKWINSQTYLEQGYTKWGQNQPAVGTCGAFVTDTNYHWESDKCSYTAMYICEK